MQLKNTDDRGRAIDFLEDYGKREFTLSVVPRVIINFSRRGICDAGHDWWPDLS